MMILQTLGSIRLVRDDGTEVDEILRQPKRLALLAYLASPRPGVWHRRDVLLAAFWPDFDAAHARSALRNSLYVLRQHLEDGVIRTRGDEEVSLDPALLVTDASLLECDVAAGRFADAVKRYEGDVLPGLHVADAEGFETWLHEERLRVRALARSAGMGLAAACELSGDLAGAAVALTQVAKLDPFDESAIRRLIEVFDRSGDHARALDVYERFRARMATELEVEPSAETARLADAIRSRRLSDRERPGLVAAPVVDATIGAAGSDVGGPNEPERQLVGATPRRKRRFALSATALVFAAAPAVVLLTRQSQAASRQTLVVLPMQNATGRPDLAYVATGIDDEIATRLRGIGGLETKSAAWIYWPDSTPLDDPRIGNNFGAQVAFRSRLTQQADSLVVTGVVVDLASGRQADVGHHAFLIDSARDASSRISAAIAGVIFGKALPALPRGRSDRIDAESYRLTIIGWHQLLSEQDQQGALETFRKAIARDANNARAYAGLSSTWASMAYGLTVPFDEGAEQAEGAANTALGLDPNEGTAWLNLAAMRVNRTHSVRGVEPLLAKAISVDPGNPEIPQVKGAIYRHAWAWSEARDAARMARRLDPLNPALVDREAILGLCSNQPDEALRLYQTMLRLAPKSRVGHRGAARALGRLGRWDEAIAELKMALPTGTSRDSALRDRTASGERGYWQLIRADGRRLLDSTLAGPPRWVAPARLALFRIAAGDMEAGLNDMATAAAHGDLVVYNFPCNAYADGARSSPRFWQILESLPKWDLARPVPRP